MVAVADPIAAVQGATLLVFVLPHQFVNGLCSQLRGHLSPGCRAISLIKVSVAGHPRRALAGVPH